MVMVASNQLLTLLAFSLTFISGKALSQHYFNQCLATGIQPVSYTLLQARSKVECALRCSESPRCRGVKACPRGEEKDKHMQWTCQLASESYGQCVDDHTGCYFMYRSINKHEITTSSTVEVASGSASTITTQSAETTERLGTATTKLTCQNGGVVNGDTCQCPLPYAGLTCQRYMRDCTEALDLGHRGSREEVHMIQPITSAYPFKVRCILNYGGVTKPFKKKRGTDWSQISWATAKAGINSPDVSHEFFIGLDHLHQLVSQGVYQNYIYVSHNSWQSIASAFYTNFTMGPESSAYDISYNGFFQYLPDNPSGDGLALQKPIRFSTWDHDPSGCVGLTGAAGWYGSDCGGYSMFEGSVMWPVGDPPNYTSADVVDFSLTRISSFFDD